jgi:signal transduction histidine kinase
MASELSKLEEYRHEFISNISHDFRSPLTSIRGYVTAMLDGTIPPEKQSRYLGIVLDETNRLTKLTQGLLDLNNLESYGPYVKMTEFDIIDVINKTLNTFEIKCIEKGVAIYLNNHATETMVMADKTKIQQVIYNLLDNAFKFTPAGKKIYFTLVDEVEKYVKLTLTETSSEYIIPIFTDMREYALGSAKISKLFLDKLDLKVITPEDIADLAQNDEYFQGFVVNPHSQNFNFDRNGDF